MRKPLEFTDLLRLTEERLAVFQSVIAAAPDLAVPVPSCPEWTLLELAHHVGDGRRKWATIVAAGPASSPPPASAWEGTAPADRSELPAWLTASGALLSEALRSAGPDGGTWGWWGDSQSPLTAGTAARRQLHEVTVHTYDAQLAVGDPQPLPAEVAVDGVEEFQMTCGSTSSPWPHGPAVVDYHAVEGGSWRLRLSPAGARVTRLTGPAPDPADVSATGTASDLVLLFHGRIGLDSIKVEGDRRILDQLATWEPA